MIGILGGMGPYATIEFYKKVLDLTNAKNDNEHFHIWIDMNTKIPSRNRHFIFNEESPVKGIIESINNMKKIGINNIYIPCNSASFFIPEIKRTIDKNINIIGTINTTIEHIKKNYSNKKIMVTGAYIVYNKEPYKQLENYGFKYVKHNQDIQKQVENLIYSIKEDNLSKNILEDTNKLLLEITKSYDIDILVLGCTELCIAFDKIKDKKIDIIDTNYILANYLVSKERKDEK